MCEKSYQDRRSLDSHMKVHVREQAAKDSAETAKQQEEIQPDFIQL